MTILLLGQGRVPSGEQVWVPSLRRGCYFEYESRRNNLLEIEEVLPYDGRAAGSNKLGFRGIRQCAIP